MIRGVAPSREMITTLGIAYALVHSAAKIKRAIALCFFMTLDLKLHGFESCVGAKERMVTTK
jgi:hypothetical protein